MPNLDIGNSTADTTATTVQDYSVSPMTTDGVSEGKETEYQTYNWSKQWGYFNTLPELKQAIIMRAIWDVGKGYECDALTKITLRQIHGWGKDTFDDILFNMMIIKRIGGDSYAEIIRADDGRLINLKPLDPSTIKIIVDEKGIILRYEQTSKLGRRKKAVKTFIPSEILHFSNNRLADQIHGISDIDALEDTIKADQENFLDMKQIMHRQARPMIMFKLGTDNATKISSFISKMDAAHSQGNNIYIPDDENAVSYDVIQVNVQAAVLAWRDDLRNRFYRSVGLPQIITAGGGQSSESESKVIYLAFEQIVEKSQREIEKQIEAQLGIKINLISPTSLLDNLQQDEAKDSQNALTFQQGDITAGATA